MDQKKKILLIEGNDSKEAREVKGIIEKAGYTCISVKDTKTSLKYLRKVDGVLASASAERSNIWDVKRISGECNNPYILNVLKSEEHKEWKKALKDIELYL